MDLSTIFVKLGISLGLGLLVGLQRERAAKALAGIRTFALITVLGTVCGLLAEPFGGWTVAAGLIGLGALLAVGVYAETRSTGEPPGLTTEVAALLMFAVGAYLPQGEDLAAIAVGGAVAVLLQFKEPLHAAVRKIGDADIKAIMQFVLITLVILPVLPNQNYGPGRYQVLNPFKIWLLVVLIVGISLSGYVAYKFLGAARAGALLAGLLGGVISSTATTVSYARRSRENATTTGAATVAIVIASAVTFARVLVLIAVVAPAMFVPVAPPLAAMLALMVVLALVALALAGKQPVELPAQTNPTELKSALVFGVIFAIVLLATAVGRDVLGRGGLYGVGVLSGLTDMDAITLSTSEMTTAAPTGVALSAATAWRVILLAAMSNLVFKTGVVALMARRELRWRIAVYFAIALAAGGAILALWPRV